MKRTFPSYHQLDATDCRPNCLLMIAKYHGQSLSVQHFREKYWVKNQNVTTGEAVFTIIPNNNKDFIGKAQIPLTRSEKVKIRQKVNIRFANFTDNECGIIVGMRGN
ncbi:cysteine peptidase family C39 domain-containing protein [Dysgonomonas sp. ZJ709]|uniref:cysteine peptidase family C39 domain-containing protein n=1 Tax=Dysgonomonas sp. ZJ709 TaxID=2709797 RepID=UPI0013EBF1EC|nr:cysteine peptidase family C39 domain-containing protein [Dysgonomonas sp. ZJ709]